MLLIQFKTSVRRGPGSEPQSAPAQLLLHREQLCSGGGISGADDTMEDTQQSCSTTQDSVPGDLQICHKDAGMGAGLAPLGRTLQADLNLLSALIRPKATNARGLSKAKMREAQVSALLQPQERHFQSVACLHSASMAMHGLGGLGC